MYFARRSIIALLFIAVLLTSCGAPAAGQPTPDINGTIAAAAQTLSVALFQTQTALAPVVTSTAIPTLTAPATTTALALPQLPAASPTQAYFYYPSATPTGTYYTATPLASSLAYGCNNLAFRNQDIEDGTVYKPGERFLQSWKVINTGTCPWTYTYQMVFVGGDKMEGGLGRWNKLTQPGDWTHIDMDFQAPNDPGTYTGYWRMADAEGHPFGSTLGISIVVPSPTKTPKPPTATNTPRPPTSTYTSAPPATETYTPTP